MAKRVLTFTCVSLVAMNTHADPSLTDSQLESCKEKAKPVAKEGFLGVCAREDHDDGFMYNSVPYTTTIIYDSTGEIELEAAKRSREWNSVALSLGRQAPFGVFGFHDIRKMDGHFYMVVFDAQFQPDFWGNPNNVVIIKSSK